MNQAHPEATPVENDLENAQPRKAWVTPLVSESPVNEFTELTANPGSGDAGSYS